MLLWKQFVEKVLSFPFLVEVILRHLLHQALHAVGVLLHSVQQAVQHQRHRLDAERSEKNELYNSQNSLEKF